MRNSRNEAVSQVLTLRPLYIGKEKTPLDESLGVLSKS